MTDLRRTAVHESAHLVAAVYLSGAVPAVVSCRTGLGHGGMVVHGSRIIDFGGHDRYAPLFAQDPALRARAEAGIVEYLCGSIAETLLSERVSGYFGDEVDDEALRMAQSVAELAPRDLELLQEREARPEEDVPLLTQDQRGVYELERRLVAGEEAGAHIAWLSVVARRFVLRHASVIVALADELVRTPVMSGEHAASIVRRAMPLAPVQETA